MRAAYYKGAREKHTEEREGTKRDQSSERQREGVSRRGEADINTWQQPPLDSQSKHKFHSKHIFIERFSAGTAREFHSDFWGSLVRKYDKLIQYLERQASSV